MSQTTTQERPGSAAGTAPLAVPDLGPAPKVARMSAHTRELANGLKVVVVRRPGVPLVELRLRVPFRLTAPNQLARVTMLAESMLLGTAERSGLQLAEAIGGLGAELGVSVDPDRLLVGGNVLRAGLSDLLGLLAEVLTSASYPARELTGERARLVERIAMARSQPSVIAHEARARVLFGSHPYAEELPTPDAVAAVTPAILRRMHRDRVVPDGAVLVLVGDLTPARALDQVERALAPWTSPASAAVNPPVPALAPGPLVLVDRPGAVQSNLRLGGRAVSRDHPDYPALHLANLVYGGYFSSRLTRNIREDKGYTYTPRSGFDHASAGTSFTVDADVATEVTAPALLETVYELGRMSTLPVAETELADARQYAIGVQALSVATQSGLATTLAALAAVGLDIDWIREHPRRMADVTVGDVLRVSAEYFAPARLRTVVVGDASAIRDPLATLWEVEQA